MGARTTIRRGFAMSVALIATLAISAHAQQDEVGVSPWGPDDEIGQLNRMTDATRLSILQRISSGKVYDLSVDYFIGMAGFTALGDTPYTYWLTHTPRGTAVDDPLNVGPEQNLHVTYTGDAVAMYTHMGTHIDALNHFGLNGKIWNGFEADTHLGDRGWRKAGAETIPPIVARGVLLDIPPAMDTEMLAAGYQIKTADIQAALSRQGTELERGDVVLIRTGRMTLFYGDGNAYMTNTPGLSIEAARYLIEDNGAISLGADNLSFESYPSGSDTNYVPVHTYVLGEQGVTILEVVDLEELARDQVYEFAFIGASLKFTGASAAPMRPLAIPIR